MASSSRRRPRYNAKPLKPVNPIVAKKAPLRAHARRNRERIIASARELFALRGEQVHMGDIAKHAGVGKGTLYRHFPDKAALFAEVIRERFEELCEIASRAGGPVGAYRARGVSSGAGRRGQAVSTDQSVDGLG